MIQPKNLRIGTVLLLFFISTMIFAQKYGHINTAELLSLMPEKAAAEQKLKNKAENLDKTLNELQTEYQTTASSYLKAVQNGTLSETEKSSQEKQIQDLETRIRAFNQNATKELDAMRNELLTPIITKARTAINQVADQNGYTYVFDLSAGSIIYVSPNSDNLLPLVKSNLGL